MIEDDLKAYIKAQYKSLPMFSEAAGIKYSTLAAIFDRGLNNASVQNIMKICRALGISADGLADGRIVSVSERKFMDITTVRNTLNSQLDNAAIDGKQVTEIERQTIIDAFDIAVELLRKRR